AGLGCNVLATDDSQKMIDQCVGKLKGRSEEAGVDFKKAGFKELEQFDKGKKYDLVFSDFSGLNCLPAEEITRLSATLSSLLEPRGKMILVVFGTRCGWEIGYRLLRRRGEPPNRRRRNKPVIFGPVDSKTRIYYYSPGIFTRLFSKEFRVRSSRPVGLFLPPSGLDPFFRNRKILLKILVLMEKWFGDISFLSDFADHYLVTFEKR
ncbi:MAG TPA: class I SAM-dependent methyltransferase, partial [Bacteroidales bacterium]|nr:class I SAM-dependent methyltransferase [Bacteroidales bacterium]